jgi:hypothetical protein
MDAPMRSSLVIAATGFGAILCGFAAYYMHRTLNDVPPAPPALSLANAEEFFIRRSHKKIPQSEEEHILDGRFSLVTTTDAMPPRLKEAFTTISGEQRFTMQNPDWKYSGMTGVVPFRRLRFAGLAANKSFIHYESGINGMAGNYDIVVFSIDERNKVQFLWGGCGIEGASDLEDLRRGIAAGRFTDNLYAPW